MEFDSNCIEQGHDKICYIDDNKECMRFEYSLDSDIRSIVIKSFEYMNCIPFHFIPLFLVFCVSQVNELLYFCRWTRVCFRKEEKELVALWPRKRIWDDLQHGEWVIIEENFDGIESVEKGREPFKKSDV